MNQFLNSKYLLKNQLAEKLYESYAKELPIIDYHCHIDAGEIAEDRAYENPTQIMLRGDHYKWRVMRAAGIGEPYITGNKTDKEKFCAFAEALELAAGHPVYFWTHMELKNYFGYNGCLNKRTADEIWEHCCNILKSGLTAREILRTSNVQVICTTDDPADDLSAHKTCREDSSLNTKVLPTYRPDKSINISKPEFVGYIEKLGMTEGVQIQNLVQLKSVLEKRLELFIRHGCKAADHGLDRISFSPCSEEKANEIFCNALKGKAISPAEAEEYMTHMMLFFGRLYAEKHMVMQLHYGALRNVNGSMFKRLGPDAGFDCIGDTGCGAALAAFLDELQRTEELPKTIVYSLNPADNALLDTITGSFYQQGIKSKVHHGAAWWFNDNRKGIEEHLQTYASLTPIGTFLGMLTDSRCLFSFSRHDFFRRIFCTWLAAAAEQGEFLGDLDSAGRIVKNVSYDNVKDYFGF